MALENGVNGHHRTDSNGLNGGFHNYVDQTADTARNGDSNGRVGLNGDEDDGPQWQLYDHPVENFRPIKVIVIGAGFSGIYLGIRIPERIRNCELTIYEKNEGVGGTWWENRYPGAACDVPSHSYQYSFNPKPDWSALYSPAYEIRDYLEETARKYSANRFIKLKHEIKSCTWNQSTGKWTLQIQGPDGSIFEDSCDVLVSARGLLNHKQWPSIDGLDNFNGEVMHSAGWNDEFDCKGKRVGIIGVGSSAIQIVPQLQKQVSKLSCFIRGQTWISPPFAEASANDLGIKDLFFSRDQIERLRTDPDELLRLRTKMEADSNNIHAITLKGSPFQIMTQKHFEEGMRERLKDRPEIFKWLMPKFAPGCRRLTPGPGFLEALTKENVDYIRDAIDRVESKGILTKNGTLHELDAIVCATGFYSSAAPPFPVTGTNGETVQNHWKERATNYLSLATDQFPNHFFMLGPNAAIGEGSLVKMMESTGDYIVKAIRKLQRENIKSMTIKPERVRDFTRYCDRYFERTVYMDNCASWYRKDGQGRPGKYVTGLWPGGTLHCIEALRSPRWEDWDYEYPSEANGAEVNQLAWLGNGWTFASSGEDHKPSLVELSFYLQPLWLEREFGVPVFPLPEENEQFLVRPFSN